MILRFLFYVCMIWTGITMQVFAVECSAVFPGPKSLSSNFWGYIDSSTTCNGGSCYPLNSFEEGIIPAISPSTPFSTTSISDGVYEATNWDLPKNSRVEFTGSGTAVIYLTEHSTIPQGTRINEGGPPENVIIAIDGNLTIEKNARINAYIYSDRTVNVEQGATFNGAISGDLWVSAFRNSEFTYDSSNVNNLNPHGFCEVPPITCDVADTYSAVIRTDDFSTTKSAWRANNFDRSVSNWPGESIFNSASENQTIQYQINNELQINGGVSSGGDNEYGMVEYDLASDGVDSSNAQNYSIYSNIDTHATSSTNNDIGIVFGYVDDDNYYLARWTKVGTTYSDNDSFPGNSRQLDLIKVSGGVATTLDSLKEVPSNNISMMVVASDNGIGVCTAGNGAAPSAMDLKLYSSEVVTLNDFGAYSYDNDIGVEYDDIELRCEDCVEVPVSNDPLAFYQFEQNDFLSGILDSSPNGNDGTNIGGASIADGKYCRAFDSDGTNTSSVTDNAFSSIDLDDDVGRIGTISFWFNSHSDWNSGGYNGGERTLFDASLNAPGNSDKYFSLEIQQNGVLRFTFEDSSDRDFSVQEPNISARQANTWYYVTVTWDYSADNFQIYVDGSLRINANRNTNGNMNKLGPIVFGDNSSTYGGNGNGSLPSFYSANGRFDEVRIYDRVLTQAEISTDMLDDAGCAPLFSHYLIEHDGNGLTCDAEPITVKACVDASCSIIDTANDSDVTLFVNGAFPQVISLNNGISSNASFNYTDTTIPATLSLGSNYQCLDTSANSNNCNVTFSDVGFIFSNIGNQIAGNEFSGISLQAVKAGTTNPGVCEPLFTNSGSPINIDIAMEYVTPNRVTTNSYTIDLAPIAKNLLGIASSYNYTPVPLLFDSTSTAVINNNVYHDAGEIRLYARYVEPASGGLPSYTVSGGSNTFWVQPDKFLMTATDPVSPFNDLNATTFDGTPTYHAGKPFNFSITAVNRNNVTTTNYQSSAPQLSVQRTGPTTVGIEGFFTYVAGNALETQLSPSVTFKPATISFANGVFNSNTAEYNEVGLIAVDFQDADYGNLPTGSKITVTTGSASGVSPPQPLNIGRFTPAYFEQTVEEHGDLKGECGIWAYSGQMDSAELKGAILYDLLPVLEVSAFNARRVLTQNYRDDGTSAEDYMKLEDDAVSITPPTQDIKDGKLGVGNPILLTSANINTPVNAISLVSGGVVHYQLSDEDNFIYEHTNNSLLPPFTAEFDMAIASIIDSDGVVANVFEDIELRSGVEIRFGRLILENSYGSETKDLPQMFKVQYLDLDPVSGEEVFKVNEDDNCSLITSLGNRLTATRAPTNGVVPQAPPTIVDTGNVGNGEYRGVDILAPGNRGQMNVEYEAFPWLKFDWGASGNHDQNPTAEANFGLYRGNDRVIYWREVSN